MPQLLQPFVFPQTFYARGSTNLCQRSGQERQPFPAPWAPPAGVTPQTPPAGLQMAPWGGCFNPQAFRLPPPAAFAIGHGVASPPGAALQGPQGCGIPPVSANQWAPQGQPQLFLPYNHQGRAAAPASPVLPPSLPSYHHLKGQYAQDSLSGTAQPLGAPPGSGSPPGNAIPRDEGTTRGGDISLGSEVPMDVDIPPGVDISLGSDVPMHEDTLPGSDNSLGSDTTPSHSATLRVQDIRDAGVIPAGNIVPPKKVLLVEAMRHPDCSLGAVGISQNDPSNVPMARDPGGTSGTISHHKTISLWLPKKMHSADYSVPGTSKAILSTEGFNTIRMKAEDPRRDAGTNLPPPQGSVSQRDIRLEKRGEKQCSGSLPKSGSKRKAPAASAGAGGWE